MYKLPKGVLIIIFLLICGLLFSIICLIRTLYGKNISFSEIEYFIIISIIGFLAFLAGIAFILPFQSWTIETLVLRLDNVITINALLINLQRRKIELIEKDPILQKIPDTVRVIISEHEVKGDRKK